LNAYEMTYIVRPDLDEEQIRTVIDGVASRLQTSGAEVVATVPWNPPRRRMAYAIKDFGDGFYVTTVFRIDSPALGPLENALRLNDRILRYLLVQATETNIKQAQQRMQQASAPAPEPQPARAPVAVTTAAPAPADTTPAEQPQAEQTPAVQPQAEQTPTVQPQAEQAPAEQTPEPETIAEPVAIATSETEAEPQPKGAVAVEEES